ncbi:PREDICTED: uncharacterized protein LOC109352849 [Lupinus angustifolius]|uniref:uncharacterized protein LOC109352849 n=1 Tax=Lupinus angustifolius TaxID=3871 RepID=UPI00092E8497|nr:PREDICTED: uncharacterized protein LOC109352849 [Lupinus angustifolius]
MVSGLPITTLPEKICEVCLIGKQARNSFKTEKMMTSKSVLEIVHSDVCGPFETPSLSGNKYFIIFVDEFSRMTWVDVLKTKSEAFVSFKNFKAVAEKESGKHLKILKTDGGDQKRTKLQDKSEALILIGYHSNGAYKLLDPINDRVVISRDVLVLENEKWNWRQMQTSLKKLVPEVESVTRIDDDTNEISESVAEGNEVSRS